MKTALILIGNDLITHSSDTLDIVTDLDLFEDTGYNRYLLFNHSGNHDVNELYNTIYYGNRKKIRYRKSIPLISVIFHFLDKMDRGVKFPEVLIIGAL